MDTTSANLQQNASKNLQNPNTMRLPSQINVGKGRVNLLSWKRRNIRDTWLLGTATMLILGLIAWLISIAISPEQAVVFTVLALLFGAGQNVISYWFSDKIALSVARTRPATKEEHRYLVHITEAVAMGAGVPTPRIFVIDSPAPNAFATGRNPKYGAIAVTTGLMQMMDRQELEGVIAHEMAHIRNHDILISTMLAATVGATIVLRDIFLRAMRYGGGGGRSRSRSSNEGGGQAQVIAYVALLILIILAPMLTSLLRMAVSRRREYVADAAGAYITRNPEALARALEKLKGYKGNKLEVSDSVQHMFFSNPVKKLNASQWFATHPPIDERISLLRRM